MAKIALNFTARANTAPLVTSLHQVRAAAAQSMGGVQTSAIKVQAPLNRLNQQIQTGRLSFRDLSRTMRNSSRIIAENNALLKAQAVSFLDASGNARVYLNVIRGTAATQATLNQRLGLGVTALKAFGAQTIATGKNVQWAGRQVMVGLSLPLIALAVAATRGAEEFDKQMTRMVKVTNLSAVGIRNSMGEFVQTFEAGSDRMEAAVNSIERQGHRLAGIGASMGFMADQTSKLAAEFSQMGFAGTALDGLTEQTLRLSRVSGADLTDSMNLSRLAVMAFGKELGEGENSLINTFSRLNMIENRTSLSLSEMAGAIPIVAGVAKNLGIEIETLGGMLALMKDKGIAAREGATSLRTGLIRLVQDATDPAVAAFDKLNINILELQEMNRGNVFGLITDLAHVLDGLQNSGEMAAEKTELFIAAIGKMVGTRAAARFTSMLEGLGGDVEQYTEIVNGFEVQQFRFVEGVDEASDAFRAMGPALMDSNEAMKQFLFEEKRVNESLAGTAEILRAELNLELRRFGRQILGARNAVVSFARDVIRGFNSLSERTRNIILVFAGLIAVLGPATMIFGVFLNAFGQIITLFARMIPGLKLTTAALEAEKKAFDRNSASIIANSSSKQAMIQTNGTLAASTNAVTGAVLSQSAAYAALGANMAGASGRLAVAGGGAAAVGRAGRATRTAAIRRSPTGEIIRDSSGRPMPREGIRFDPKTGRHIGTRADGTQIPLTSKGVPTEPKATAGGGAIASSAMIAAMTIPQIMAHKGAKFNPTRGMDMGHTEMIRQMLGRESLIGQMGPGAQAEQLMSRNRGGMAPIDAIRHHAVREAAAGYERAAAIAVQTNQRVPSVQDFMRTVDQKQLVQSATLRAGTEGVTGTRIDPQTKKPVSRLMFQPQPQGMREMAGMAPRMGNRDIINLTRDQRASLGRELNIDLGRRTQVGDIEKAVRARGGSSTEAFNARNRVESMVQQGEIRSTRQAQTRADLIRSDRAIVAREVKSAVSDKRIADTPEARKQLAREITPDRAKPGKEGRAGMRRDRAVGARETLMGKRPPQTALEKGISSGRNAALMAMMAPFVLIGKAVKLLATSLFGVIPAFKILGSLMMATTMPIITLFGNAILTVVSGLGALGLAALNLSKQFIANAVGGAMNLGRRGAHALSSRMVLNATSPRHRPARNASGRFITPPAAPAAPGSFVPTPLTAGRRAAGLGGVAGRAAGRAGAAGRLAGRGVLGVASSIPLLGTGIKAARSVAAATRAAGGVRGGMGAVGTGLKNAGKSSGMAEGFRRGRDASILRQTGSFKPKTTAALARGQLAGTKVGDRLTRQAGAAAPHMGRAGGARAAVGGARGAAMAMGGAKGGLASFALGSVGGAAATVAIPILLTLGAAAIANPADFKASLESMFGPTLKTIKSLWDGVSSAFTRLFDVIRGGESDGEGFGSTMSKWAGILVGLFAGALGNLLTIILGLVRGIADALTGVFKFLKGDGPGAAEAFGMAWRGVWGSVLEGMANFFDMLRDIPIIGKAFGAVADRAREWADATNEAYDAATLVPDAIAEVNKGLREINKIAAENKTAYEDIEKIVEELAAFDIIDQDDIDRLVGMVTVSEDLQGSLLDAKKENVDAIYDEIAGMEHLTDEQIIQIGQLVMRKRIESQLDALKARHESLINDLQSIQENGHDHIISQRVAQLRLAQLQLNIENEMAKEVGERSMSAIQRWSDEAKAIEATNSRVVTRAGLDDLIATTQEEINQLSEKQLGIADEVNSQIAIRTQRMQMARQATAEETEQMDELADAAERAKRAIQALQNAMGEVMGDIQDVLKDIISSQSSFVDTFFSDISDASEKYFNDFIDMFDDQTEMMLEDIEERAEHEKNLIDDIADSVIEKIEDEMSAEDRLEKKREEFFRKEKARIDFLSSRRAGEIQIQEELLRGNVAQAAILQVQQRATSENFFSDIVQERESELKDMRNESREQRIADINFERELLNHQIDEELEAGRESIEFAREAARQQAEISAGAARDLVNNAQEASSAAIAAEEQRIENYLREWQRVTPATEEEFRQHTKNLQDFMSESGARLQEEINSINDSLRESLGEIDEDFTDSVNSQSIALATMLENSRFTLSGIYEAVKITSDDSLIAMLSMIDGFVGGLSEGFMRGEDLVTAFAEKFERDIDKAFRWAADLAQRIMGEEDKWEAAGVRAAEAYSKPLQKMLDNIEARVKKVAADAAAAAASFGDGPRSPFLRNTGPFLPFEPGAGHLNTRPGSFTPLGPGIDGMQDFITRARTLALRDPDARRRDGETAAARTAAAAAAAREQEASGGAGAPLATHRRAQSAWEAVTSAPSRALELLLARIEDNLTRGVPRTPSFHTGGLVGGLKSDEVPAILQKGEFVIRKSAVSSVGTDFLEKINSSNAVFSSSSPRRVSVAEGSGGSSSTVENNYNLSFKVDGGNIDESRLAQKVVFEIKKMERSSGGGRRVAS